MIKKQDWIWHGLAGHFICSPDCRYRQCTEIGKYLISTVGEYRPDYKKGELIEIGANRFYETMVFEIDYYCDTKKCGCGHPMIVPSELDFLSAKTKKEADKNHLYMCEKWSRK